MIEQFKIIETCIFLTSEYRQIDIVSLSSHFLDNFFGKFFLNTGFIKNYTSVKWSTEIFLFYWDYTKFTIFANISTLFLYSQ